MNTVVEKEVHTPVKPAHEQTFLVPLANIFETRDAYVIEAEMPGVARDGMEITLEGNTLILKGRRDLNPPKAQALYVESKPAHFLRSFELDPAVDPGKISAHLEQGLLQVHLAKAERVKPRKIAIRD